MKKWQKVLAIIVAVIAVLAICVVCIYQFYAKDKIEQTLEKASVVLNDEKLQQDVEDFAEELVANGELDSSQLEGYKYYKNADNQPSKRKTLIDRVREAMTAEEFAFAMSMYSKIDVGYVVSNLNSNREGVKAHIKSVLTSDELSRSLEIYGKYSYLLK